ncbi:MAG TPA: hypothetical protein VF642_02610 [Propionibacteriaceae bacterium]
MSTATQKATVIPIEHYSDALVRGDLSLMLSCYHDSAELKLASCSDTDRLPRVVVGKSEIGVWVGRLLASHPRIRVVERLGKGTEMTLIIECRGPDETQLVVACTAVLVEGLIAHQFVVVV